MLRKDDLGQYASAVVVVSVSSVFRIYVHVPFIITHNYALPYKKTFVRVLFSSFEFRDTLERSKVKLRSGFRTAGHTPHMAGSARFAWRFFRGAWGSQPKGRRAQQTSGLRHAASRVGASLGALGAAAAAAVASEAESDQSELKTFSLAEVARHNGRGEDCWIVIDGRVYDVTSFLDKHPGTKRVLLSVGGTDASKQFHQLHGPDILPEHGAPLLIGEIPLSERTAPSPVSPPPPTGPGPLRSVVADYVVVGAGSAGCLVARRLSSRGHSVLLVEAGDAVRAGNKEADVVFDPMKYGASFATRLNWGLGTVPQPACADRRIRCTRGRGVGGTSLVNGMLYNRGAREIFDEWAALGAAGWSASQVLPYFMRHEQNSRGLDAKGHGVGGEVRVSDIPDDQLSPIARAFHWACQQAGFEPNPDQNSLLAPQDGVQIYQCFIRDSDGQRVTASRAFLPNDQGAAKDGTPLTVAPNSLVKRVRLCTDVRGGSGPVATGVCIETDSGEAVEAVARREVVLCAGVIGSPQLLMLSGLGPRDHLESVGVETAVDLSGVGSNLVDHPRVACRWESRLKRLDPTGFFSHVEGNLYAHSPHNTGPPDIQIQQDHVRTNEDLLTDPPTSTGFNLKPHCVRPRSRGTVRLRDANPRSKPLIDPAYLSDPEGADLTCLVEGVKTCRRVVAQKAFRRVRGREILPGPDVETDEQIAAWVRENVDTGYHPVGTCKMGAVGDPSAVVGPDLRVRGVNNLRVVDASVMPVIPNGNTQAATFMIAEKGAALMLADSECQG